METQQETHLFPYPRTKRKSKLQSCFSFLCIFFIQIAVFFRPSPVSQSLALLPIQGITLVCSLRSVRVQSKYPPSFSPLIDFKLLKSLFLPVPEAIPWDPLKVNFNILTQGSVFLHVFSNPCDPTASLSFSPFFTDTLYSYQPHLLYLDY